MKLKETGFWEDEEYEDFSSFDNLVKHKEEALDNPDESSD